MAQALSFRRRALAVAGGGFCGTIFRVMLSSLIQGWLGKAWPYDILLINITGAMILAFVTTLADATVLIGPTRRLFINVGILGAYTTFSSLALGDVLLLAGGRWLSALLYILASGFGGIIAVFVGDLLGQRCIVLVQHPSSEKAIQKPEGRLAPASLDETVMHDHFDIQDDLLLEERAQQTRDHS